MSHRSLAERFSRAAKKILFPRYDTTDLDEFLSSVVEGDRVLLSVADRFGNPVQSFGPSGQEAYVHLSVTTRDEMLPFRRMIEHEPGYVRPHGLFPSATEVQKQHEHFKQRAASEVERLLAEIEKKRPGLSVEKSVFSLTF